MAHIVPGSLNLRGQRRWQNEFGLGLRRRPAWAGEPCVEEGLRSSGLGVKVKVWNLGG